MFSSVLKSMALTRMRDFFELCKPRVVLLMLLTVLVGMFLAVPGMLPWELIFFSLLGIALLAFSAAAMNHLLDRHIDAMMMRTCRRPIAEGRITTVQAFFFAMILGFFGFVILKWYVNELTALLAVLTLVGYAGIYTGYLKRATSQNIVIGGLAGALPPLLGWTAAKNQLDPEALLPVLIVFTWTPPHFWALAVYRVDEYKRAKIPMLPVTHGLAYTRLAILLYTILLFPVTILPFLVGMSGIFYLLGALGALIGFMYWAIRLYVSESRTVAIKTFRFSIHYLMIVFLFLLVDHWIVNYFS